MAAKSKTRKFRPVANPAMAAAMRGLRSSSAASPHVPKPKKGTRSARKSRAIRESWDF